MSDPVLYSIVKIYCSSVVGKLLRIVTGKVSVTYVPESDTIVIEIAHPMMPYKYVLLDALSHFRLGDTQEVAREVHKDYHKAVFDFAELNFFR